jgi:Phage tail lysozyme
MTNKIGIGVEAQFDTSQVEQKINALGQKVAQANKVQYAPVSVKTVDDLNKVTKQFDQLLKIHTELQKRIKATGQNGRGLADLDFDQLYPDASVRNRQMRKVMEYTLGGVFSPLPGGGGGPGGPNRPPPVVHPPAPGGGGGGGGGPGMGMQVTQAGLRAFGPAGGVAANALGAGASSGFGAGLMGLLGGMLALGVSKIISSAMEKVTQAENNNVAYDRLKRTLGDVNVSFDALKAVVNASADNLKITYEEAGRLGEQFAKMGNMRADQMPSLAGELGVGVGLARAFGLDPSQGVGVMGQMRGLGITKDVQESKRFALLIGETIGRSGAFAKADEVMDALAGFAQQQTRSSLGAANMSGYAGAFSALVGAGVPGLDPSGAGALLARVNAALTGGGAKGEASQFFTAQVGASLGLNPLQTQVLREGGAFATNDEAFGGGSIASRYGMRGPGGNKTYLQASLEMLRRQYGGNPGLLAQATANHLGISMRQAMAMLSISPNQMGEMQKYADLGTLSASGIGNLAKVRFGSAGDRQAIARNLLGRNDISAEEKARIAGAGADDAKLKEVLSSIVASHEQERTMGSDIRDSKNALDNIKTAIADKAVPLLNEMRHGIMYLAGKGEMGADQIMRKVIDADSASRAKAIEGRFAPELEELRKKRDRAAGMSRISDVTLMEVYRSDPQRAEQMRKEREEATKVLTEVEKRIAELEKQKGELLEKENLRRKAEIERMEKDEQKRAMDELGVTGSISAVQSSLVTGWTPGSAGGGRGGNYQGSGGAAKADVNDAMQFFMSKGWSREQAAGIVANLVAESKLFEGAVGDNGQAYGIAQWHPDRQANFAKWAGKDIRQSTKKEQMEFVHWEMTEGRERAAGARLRAATSANEAGAVVSRHYERPKWADAEAYNRGNLAESYSNKFDPITINVNVHDGKGNTTTQTVQTRVQSNARLRMGH